MEDKIKAIENQIENLRDERENHSREEHRSKKNVRKHKLTLELIDKVIDDLIHRKEELLMKTPQEG